jgi:hypothetical protein
MDGRIRTLPSVLHILGLDRNLISITKMSDASVKIMFENKTCRMVRGEMVLLRGVHIGTMCKILGTTISDVCTGFIVLDIGAKE